MKSMMPIEKQVVSLELARKLKELNCKQESLFWWIQFANGYAEEHFDYKKNLHWEIRYNKNTLYNFPEKISAFTCAELIDMVEKYSNEWAVGYDDSGCFYRFVRGERGCGSMMQGFGGKSNFNSSGDEETFVDAFAQWVIYLLENGLMGKERG